MINATAVASATVDFEVLDLEVIGLNFRVEADAAWNKQSASLSFSPSLCLHT